MPHPVRNATETEIALCSRGPAAAPRSSTSGGVRTVKLSVVHWHSVCEACCVNRQHFCDHKVPRSRARVTVVLRGSACSCVSACSTIKRAGFRRCVGGQAPKSASLHRSPSINAAMKGGVPCQEAKSASESPGVRQSNYAFERPGLGLLRARVRRALHFAPSARLRRTRPVAQRER